MRVSKSHFCQFLLFAICINTYLLFCFLCHNCHCLSILWRDRDGDGNTFHLRLCLSKVYWGSDNCLSVYQLISNFFGRSNTLELYVYTISDQSEPCPSKFRFSGKKCILKIQQLSKLIFQPLNFLLFHKFPEYCSPWCVSSEMMTLRGFELICLMTS